MFYLLCYTTYNIVKETCVMNKSITKAIRLTSEENEMFLAFANAQGITFSELCKSAILERIEDLLDIELADKSYQEYLSDSETVSFTELKSQLGI